VHGLRIWHLVYQHHDAAGERSHLLLRCHRVVITSVDRTADHLLGCALALHMVWIVDFSIESVVFLKVLALDRLARGIDKADESLLKFEALDVVLASLRIFEYTVHKSFKALDHHHSHALTIKKICKGALDLLLKSS